MRERERSRVLDDPELLRLFGDDPQALAVLDAAAATQGSARGARVRRRAAIVAAGAVLVASAIAVPALGLVGRLIDFSHARPAHALVIWDFAKLEFARAGDGPGVEPSKTRRVYVFQTPDGRYALYATPTRAGGFCWGVQGLGDTCVARNDPRIEPLYSGVPIRGSKEPSLIAGASYEPISRAALTFQDGSTVELPLVAVSKPIDAVFFLYDVPRSHWRSGTLPSHVTVYGTRGESVGLGRLLYETR